MKNIVHVRIDYRLIHGQVITKWLKVCDANKILIIDDELANNDFLAMVYKMAAPTGIEVIIATSKEACKKWNEDDFYEGKILLLFKDIKTAVTCINEGIYFPELQVGGLENKPGKKVVHNQISLDQNDYYCLKEIAEKDVRVYFQTVPAEEISDLEDVKRKLKI